MSVPATFKIDIPDEKVERLRQKLMLVDLPDEIEDTDDEWARGVPLADIKHLLTYWVDMFDWKTAEAELNKLPQFHLEVKVDNFGIHNLHFVHQMSAVEQAVPLLFLHSWPGGFFEVSKMLPLLVDDGKGPAFHIVAPSLVDFGFSSVSNKVCSIDIFMGEALIQHVCRKGLPSTSTPKHATSSCWHLDTPSMVSSLR